jgi:hypothetical protein
MTDESGCGAGTYPKIRKQRFQDTLRLDSYMLHGSYGAFDRLWKVEGLWLVEHIVMLKMF